MKLSIKLLLVMILLLISQSAFSATVVSETKLNDGSYIRKCRFSNGVVDYCGSLDAVNAIRAINDLSLTATPQQLAEIKKQEREFNAKLEVQAKEYLSKLSMDAEQLKTLPNKKLENIAQTTQDAELFFNQYKERLSQTTKDSLNNKITAYKSALDEIIEKQEARGELMEHVKNGIRTNVNGGFQAVQRFENATKIFDAFNRAK
ncbi:hypothetical protein HDR58_10265 [bacterium]|nr:hypothetical protein [bacterium]